MAMTTTATAMSVAKMTTTTMMTRRTMRTIAKTAEMEELARQKLQLESVGAHASTSEMSGEGERPPRWRI